jgi:hypothetical protein
MRIIELALTLAVLSLTLFLIGQGLGHINLSLR